MKTGYMNFSNAIDRTDLDEMGQKFDLIHDFHEWILVQQSLGKITHRNFFEWNKKKSKILLSLDQHSLEDIQSEIDVFKQQHNLDDSDFNGNLEIENKDIQEKIMEIITETKKIIEEEFEKGNISEYEQEEFRKQVSRICSTIRYYTIEQLFDSFAIIQQIVVMKTDSYAKKISKRRNKDLKKK